MLSLMKDSYSHPENLRGRPNINELPPRAIPHLSLRHQVPVTHFEAVIWKCQGVYKVQGDVVRWQSQNPYGPGTLLSYASSGGTRTPMENRQLPLWLLWHPVQELQPPEEEPLPQEWQAGWHEWPQRSEPYTPVPIAVSHSGGGDPLFSEIGGRKVTLVGRQHCREQENSCHGNGELTYQSSGIFCSPSQHWLWMEVILIQCFDMIIEVASLLIYLSLILLVEFGACLRSKQYRRLSSLQLSQIWSKFPCWQLFKPGGQLPHSFFLCHVKHGGKVRR